MVRIWCLVLVVACGPTAAEIKTAKEASYQASPQDVYRVAETETAKSYPIAERMPDELIFATRPQWYTDTGRYSSDPEAAQRKSGHMQVSFVVLVTAAENGAKITVTPKAVDYEANKPKPRELAPEDKMFPKWITERADKLQVAIHRRLREMKPNSQSAVTQQNH